MRFVERRGYRALYPGFENLPAPKQTNRFNFMYVDHLTAYFQTMQPALLWMEHVLAFERFWKVEFHTDDVSQGGNHGSGLRSIVMYDPISGVKFANNEPYRPFFKQSQINVFNEDHHGDGIQHAALAVRDILSAVRGMRKVGTEFMPTPDTYYEDLPKRIQNLGIKYIDEDIGELNELQILLDGEK